MEADIEEEEETEGGERLEEEVTTWKSGWLERSDWALMKEFFRPTWEKPSID